LIITVANVRKSNRASPTLSWRKTQLKPKTSNQFFFFFFFYMINYIFSNT
jgi:hypothetical protein